MPRKAIVIDLDGTLCLRNTFNIFLSEFLQAQTRHPLRFITIAAIMGMRKLRLTSHARMKRSILTAYKKHTDHTVIERTVDAVEKSANRNVTDLIDQCRSDNYATILASAAPHIYASAIARTFNFDFCVATPTPEPHMPWHETRGDKELEAINAIARSVGLTIDIAVSDHEDDTPIWKAANRAILVQLPVGNLVEIS